MTIWANAAICAVKIINDQNLSPEEAWFEAISKYYNTPLIETTLRSFKFIKSF